WLTRGPARVVAFVHLPGRDLLREVHALEARPRLGRLACRAVVDLAVGRMHHGAVGRAAVADAAGELARIDAGDADEPVRLEPTVQMLGRAPVRWLGDVDAHDESARGRSKRLDVLDVGSDIPDVREGEGDDLTGVGGIGHDLL